MGNFRVLSSRFKKYFFKNFELQITLASQVEARFGPNLDQIWDHKFSRSICSRKIFTAGTNFNRALEGGDFTVLIYYLLLHHQGDRGTKTKCENYIFCLRGSKNIFHILGSEFGPPDDRSPPPASRQAKSGFGTRKFQDELEMALVFRFRGLRLIRYCAHDTPIHMRC